MENPVSSIETAALSIEMEASSIEIDASSIETTAPSIETTASSIALGKGRLLTADDYHAKHQHLLLIWIQSRQTIER